MDNLAEWVGSGVGLALFLLGIVRFISDRPKRDEVQKMIDRSILQILQNGILTLKKLDDLTVKFDGLSKQVAYNTGIISNVEKTVSELQEDIKSITKNYMTKEDCRFLQESGIQHKA